jgi:putative aminopeptidase FrvX
MNMNLALLKEILCIPTFSLEEEKLINYLKKYLSNKPVSVEVDTVGNILVTKGVSDCFPCLVAHTDTVHALVDEIDIREVERVNSQGESKPALTGYLPKSDVPTGCGGDDKAGVFICLQLLDKFEEIKIFFPIAEEIGCKGTNDAKAEWFTDVGYFIQFDSPENDTMSLSLRAKRLFDEKGTFWDICKDLIHDHGIVQLQHHSFTDVGYLGERNQVDCLNLATGYYNYHKQNEYVIIEDVQNAIDLGQRLLTAAGNKKYSNTYHSQFSSNDLVGLK